MALGVIFKNEESLYNLQLKEGTQQRVINRLNKLGLLSVAAHPSFVTPKPFPWEWPEILDYQFYPGQINSLGGIEIFNDHDQRQYIRTRNWYLTLLSQRRDIFVTSGCDSHAPVDPIVADEKR